MSKLALPPLLSLPPASQAAFRAIAAWANTIDTSLSETNAQFRNSARLPRGNDRPAVSADEINNLVAKKATDAAEFVLTRDSNAMVRNALENSGTLPPIEMRAPVLFSASNRVGNRVHHLGVGAGGLIGAYQGSNGGDWVHTFGILTSDGSFFFGARDEANTSDPAHRQIIFDATANAITFGSSIKIQRSDGIISLLDDIPWDATTYTFSNLEADLAAGVGYILAGHTNDGTYRMDVKSDAVMFYHKNVFYKGTVGAAKRGPGQNAIAITANGIAMGYNDPVTGEWKDAVAIDALGNATFRGTVKANSIIEVGAKVDGTGKTMGDIPWGATNYTKTHLQNDLTAGVGNVVAGLGQNYGMKVEGGGVYFYRNGAVYNAPSATAVSTGTNLPMLAITANGIAMGYNNKTTGAWVESVAILASGSASFKGAVNATSGNFVDSITVNGYTLGTILAGALKGASAVQINDTILADKLNSTGTDILSGDIQFTSGGGFRTSGITFDDNGTSSGKGVAFTDKGIVGRNDSGITFTLDAATGNATFKGNISGSNGEFAGYVLTDQYVYARGNSATAMVTSGGVTQGSASGAICGVPSNLNACGVIGRNAAGTNNVDAAGVLGYSTTFHAPGVWAHGVLGAGANALALRINGRVQWDGININTPPNNTTTFLRGDGVWATPPGGGSVAWTGITGKPDLVLASQLGAAQGKTVLSKSVVVDGTAYNFLYVV